LSNLPTNKWRYLEKKEYDFTKRFVFEYSD